MIDFIKYIYMTAFRATVFAASSLVVAYFAFSWYKSWDMEKNYIPPFYDDGVCNVALVPVGGEIGIFATNAVPGADGYTQSNVSALGDVDRIIYDLDYAKNAPHLQAVVMQVDSYGGRVAASETLYNYLLNYPKPIVTLFRDAGLSAGYLISLPTNRIFAGRTTDVGSIGVTSSSLNYYEKNKKDGLEYVQITSGKYKDALSPDKKIVKEEVEMEKQNVDNLAEIFKDLVVVHRKLPKEVVDDLADGRSWIGEEAYKLGLIDEVGDMNSVLNYLSKNLFANSEGTAIACLPSRK